MIIFNKNKFVLKRIKYNSYNKIENTSFNIFSTKIILINSRNIKKEKRQIMISMRNNDNYEIKLLKKKIKLIKNKKILKIYQETKNQLKTQHNSIFLTSNKVVKKDFDIFHTIALNSKKLLKAIKNSHY